ncbi:MAG: fibronectin type III domain-containing protein [Schlesneria sp.]
MNNVTAFYRQFLRGFFSRSKSRRVRRLARSFTAPAQVEMLESRQMLTVTFHGGAVLQSVESQAVYLGSDWQNTSSLTTQTGQFDTYLNTLVSGQYMDMLTNAGYGVGRGTSTAGSIDNISLSKTSGITDASIQSDIQAMINSHQLQTPDANRLYVVFVEPGVVVYDGSSSSTNTFLGYHGAFGGKTATGASADIHYAVLPYPGGVNPSPSSQGFSSAFDELTAVTSHEVAEAVTDPNVNYKALGWYDDQKNGEIGDLTRQTVVWSGYLVQDVVNQNDQVISPTSTTPTPTPTPTPLTAPTNVTVSAVSSTSALLSWSASSGAQGYRIYQVNGTQSTLIGTVSSTTTSVQITGLTAGSTNSFKVEAYNATTVADSNVVSVTLPAAPATSGPTLSAKILSATSIQLNWTAVSGASAYNIYYFDGSGNRVLLGTTNGRSTSVKVVGMTPGTTYQFQVESVSRSGLGESNVISVNSTANVVHSTVVHHATEWQGATAPTGSNRKSNRG